MRGEGRAKGFSPKESVRYSLNININPTVFTAITTIIGFLTLNFSTSPNFQDPEQWKPASVPMVDRQKLLLAFREATKQARLCEASEHEKPRPYIYGVKDLQIAAAFKNALGRQLVSVTLRKKYIECGSERGWADSPQWFFLGETIRSIGNNLSLIDAGDYDKDGRSEVVFWYSGYNRDGYVLLYDNFTKRTDFVWTYH